MKKVYEWKVLGYFVNIHRCGEPLALFGLVNFSRNRFSVSSSSFYLPNPFGLVEEFAALTMHWPIKG